MTGSGNQDDQASLPFYKRQPQPTVSAEDIRAEVQAADHSRELRNRLLPRALLVGVSAGLVAVAFRLSLHFIEAARDRLLTEVPMAPWSRFLLTVLLVSAGATTSVWMVRRWSPAASGSGIPQLKAVLLHHRVLNWFSLLLVKFFGGLIAMGSGMTLGREGPTIQMGGATGKMIGRLTGMTKVERFILIAAGGGAGLAAAFNAPLAGLVFVVEEIQHSFTSRVFFAALLSSVTADTISRLTMGQMPVFHAGPFAIPPLGLLPGFAVVGAVAGLLGAFFNRALVSSLDRFEKIKHWPLPCLGLVVGIVVGGIGFWQPDLLGGGHHLAEAALAGQLAIGSVCLFFFLRLVMTLFSYGSGAPGGIFAPLLVLGALSGLFVGLIAERIPGLPPVRPEVFAVVGMAALFSSVVRAPLTGIVLVVEMTGEHNLMLSLLTACLTSYFIAESLGARPIYQVLMERELEKQRKRVIEEQGQGRGRGETPLSP